MTLSICADNFLGFAVWSLVFCCIGCVCSAAAQLEKNLTSTHGKERLRLQALSEIRGALDSLEGQGTSDHIMPPCFTSFVVQR